MKSHLVRLMLGAALLAVSALAPARVYAQAEAAIVRTFSIQYLVPEDVQQLLGPYTMGRPTVTNSPRTVTLAGTPAMLATAERVLREHDRAPAMVRLRFQLIRADSVPSARRDPALADVDSAVRSLLRVSGLHLEGETVALAEVGANFRVGFPNTFGLLGEVRSIDSSANGRVRLAVTLYRDRRVVSATNPTESLIATGLTVSYGKNTVLGTSISEGVAYILSVRAERVAEPR